MLVAALLAVLAGLLTTSPPASAQADEPCFPTDPQAYPPEGSPTDQVPVDLSLGLSLLPPSLGGYLRIEDAIPGEEYCGILFSSPIALPVTVAGADGTFVFPLTVPADFPVNAMHHLDVYRLRELVGAFDFCVTPAGKLTDAAGCRASNVQGTTNTTAPPRSKGNLPFTGAYVDDLIRAGLILLAVGTFVLYVRRRRMQQPPAAQA